MNDTIVIGGGLAGLATANLLADAGLRVTLLEARGRLGGRATTDEREGHRFNQGPHGLYLAGDGLALLRSLGLDPEGGVPPAAGALGLAGGRLHRLPNGPSTLARTRLLGPADKVAVARLMGRLGSLEPLSVADRSAEEWIAATTGRPRVRDLLRGLTRLTTYSADLDLLSAAVAVAQIQTGLAGVRYLDGGWQRLVDALAERARAVGVTVETGAVVSSVAAACGARRGGVGGHGAMIDGAAVDGAAIGDERDGGVASDGVVVTTSAGAWRARSAVVAGLSPSLTARLVGSDELTRRAAEAVPVRAATLDVGLRRLPHPERRFVLGLDQPLYYSVHNPPADLGSGATLHVMRYLDRHDADPGPDRRVGERGDGVRAELERLLDLAQPGWRAELVASRFQRRLTVAHAVPGPCRQGPAGTAGLADPVLASPRLVDRPGIYVAGDWVGPSGSLADATLVSARRAAEAVLADRAARRGAEAVVVDRGADPDGAGGADRPTVGGARGSGR